VDQVVEIIVTAIVTQILRLVKVRQIVVGIVTHQVLRTAITKAAGIHIGNQTRRERARTRVAHITQQKIGVKCRGIPDQARLVAPTNTGMEIVVYLIHPVVVHQCKIAGTIMRHETENH